MSIIIRFNYLHPLYEKNNCNSVCLRSIFCWFLSTRSNCHLNSPNRNQGLKKSGFPLEKIKTINEEFKTTIRAPHLTIEIETTPRPVATSGIDSVLYKPIHTQLFHNSGCRIDIDKILTAIGKQYWIMEFRLDEMINVEALKNWSTEQAGLEPGSGSKINGIYGSIEYSFLSRQLRVEASQWRDGQGKDFGMFRLIYDMPKLKWFPH